MIDMWLRFTFISYVIYSSVFFVLIFFGLGGWWTLGNIIAWLWSAYLAYEIFTKNIEIRNWLKSSGFITSINTIAFVLWTTNIWIQSNSIMVMIAIVFSLYHGYIATEWFGKWTAEKRNEKM
jgi:hypothetical protein